MSGLAAVGLGARLMGVRSALGKIPPKVWLALGCAVAVLLGVLWHHHVSGKALKAQYDAGYSQRGKDDSAAAAKLKRELDAANARIAADERKLTDEENRRIVGDADALRLSGPGKAICRIRAEPAAPSGGRVSTPAKADAAVDTVPDAERIDLIAMPFAGAVQGSEEHDQLLNENTRWRDWYERLKANWPKEPTP